MPGHSRISASSDASDTPRRRPIIYTQDACLRHRNIATGDNKNTLERPERLYAVNVGVAAIYARLEEARLAVEETDAPLTIVRSTATMESIPEHPAACTVLHIEREDGSTYAKVLEEWCKQSQKKITRREREVPPEFEHDLYLCPASFDTFKAAMGTVCQAIDAVAAGSKAPYKMSKRSTKEPSGTRAFVAVRPPGHHCVIDAPAGLGFVNNIAVGAVHAYYQHDYTHIVIFDIDLHHGDGTQRIVREINARRHASTEDSKDERPIMFYGSTHDVKSYPCASGESESIAAASLSVQGQDGQWIENVHMRPYTSEEAFWVQDWRRLMILIERAKQFVATTRASEERTIVLMSCGFSASIHEDPSMSKHGCYFPTAFYNKFAREACAFADRFAQGRLVSVLEGGYSNRALISGVMAHISGLADTEQSIVDPEWWDLPALEEAEKVLKRQPKHKAKSEKSLPWVSRTRQIVDCLSKPLEKDADSPTLDIPPPEPSVKPVSTYLTLSKLAPKAAGKRRADEDSSVASKRPRSSLFVTKNVSRTRLPSETPLSDLTPLPDTPMDSIQLSFPQRTPLSLSQSSASPSASPSRQPQSASPAILPAISPDTAVSSDVTFIAQQPSGTEALEVQPVLTSQTRAAAQHAHVELQHSFDDFNSIVKSAAALPQSLLRAIRPVRGCIWRLEQILANEKLVRETLSTLEEFLSDAHSALEESVTDHMDRQKVRKLDRALYDLEGATLDLKNTYT